MPDSEFIKIHAAQLGAINNVILSLSSLGEVVIVLTHEIEKHHGEGSLSEVVVPLSTASEKLEEALEGINEAFSVLQNIQ